MGRRTWLFAALLATWLLWPFALFAADAPGSKMHRTHAGVPGPTGLVDAISTEGGYAVQLPARFNDYTIVHAEPNSLVLRTDSVGGVTALGIKFSATRIVYRDGIDAARGFFARMERGEDLGGKPERVLRHRYLRYPALDFMIAGEFNRAYQRVLLLDTDLLLMVVESPRTEIALAERLAAPFFDSLTLTRR